MSDIDDIKSRINIVDIVAERVLLKQAGRNFKGLCPFHDEKTPSFIVSPDRQTFHCFGCGKGGSIFDFYMLAYHVDFVEALETLAERAGVTLTRRQTDTPQEKLKKVLYEVNHLAAEYYHYLLIKHPVGEQARQYLKERGISDKSIKTFTLGYSANDWEGLYGYLRKKGYEDEVLEKAGLVLRSIKETSRSRYYDRFRGRVMFALKDHRGRTVGFSGRVMDSKSLPAGRQEAKYINTSETPLYIKGKMLYGLDVTKDAIQKANEAILMEGELDVISSFQAGIGNAVAIKGSAVTEDHARLLRRFTERLVFALDSDMAGDAAARRGIEIAEREGFDMRVAHMSSGKDPDEAARENPALLKKALKEAVPLYDYLFTSALTRHGTDDAYAKRKFSEELIPSIAKIDNPIVRGHYVKKLAQALRVSEEGVQESIRKYQSAPSYPRPKSPSESVSTVPVRTPIEKAELYVLALIVQGDVQARLAQFCEAVEIDDMQYLPVRRILEELRARNDAHQPMDAQSIADSIPEELVSVFDEAFLRDVADVVTDSVRYDREWKQAVTQMKWTHLRSEIEHLSKSLADESLTDEAAQDIQEELRTVTAQLAALEKER